MFKIWVPVILVLGLIISALAYIKYFYSQGYMAGLTEAKLENKVEINKNTAYEIREIQLDDFNNAKRAKENEAIIINPSGCTFKPEWLREFSKLH